MSLRKNRLCRYSFSYGLAVVLFISPLYLASTPFHISQAIAQTGWEAEWERVLSAARQEGKLVAGIPASSRLRQALEKEFSERFQGIKLELIPGRASGIARRIVSEYKAGIGNIDLLVSGSGSGLALASAGATEPLKPFMILPEVKDPKHWFGGHIWVDNVTTKRYIYAFQAYLTTPGFYNTDLVKTDEISSYDDLLKPKWKGKIGFHEPRRRGAGQAMWIYLWRFKGESYLKRLVEQDLLVSTDYRQLAEMVSKGRVAIGLGTTYSVALPFIKAGLPVKAIPVPKEGVHATIGFGAITIRKNPPHPNATKIFVNWLLSKRGQEIYGKAVNNATRRLDVDTRWLQGLGIQAAKDSITVNEYLERESFFEDKRALRKPAIDLAKRLIK